MRFLWESLNLCYFFLYKLYVSVYSVVEYNVLSMVSGTTFVHMLPIILRAPS